MTSLAEKTKLIRDYSQRYLSDFWYISTGPSQGEDIWNLRTDFDRLISICSDYDDYVASQLRFLDTPHVVIIDGDSYYWLPLLINAGIEDACFFWLEGDSALRDLQVILRKPQQNVVLLEVESEEQYDAAIADLGEAMGYGYPASTFIREGDVLCIVPKAEDYEA